MNFCTNRFGDYTFSQSSGDSLYKYCYYREQNRTYTPSPNMFSIGTTKTIAQLQSLAFIDTINQELTTPVYARDIDSLLNRGYPILSWQLNRYITY